MRRPVAESVSPLTSPSAPDIGDTTWVVDASAVLAFLQDETGADSVEPALAAGVVPATNWSEIAQKVARLVDDPAPILTRLMAVGLEVEPVLRADAEVAARLWPSAPGLSLADRCCIAVAARLERPILTADQEWSTIRDDAMVAVEIVQIR